MIPITQTKVVIKNSAGREVVKGNCYAAAIASILEVPITEVPNVETLFDVDNFLWDHVMEKWLESRGWESRHNHHFKVFHDDTLKEQRDDWYQECADKLYLVSGRSPRGVMHICIFKNGKLIHDPHPTREGILTFEYFQELVTIKPTQP